jgi:hypothetical protein
LMCVFVGFLLSLRFTIPSNSISIFRDYSDGKKSCVSV